MSGIISKTVIDKLQTVRKIILKVAIWMLIGGVVLGVLMILFGDTGLNWIGKFMGTVWIIGFMMIVCVDNFKKISIEDSSVQAFALIGLVTNIIWALLWVILCWIPEFGSVCSGSTGCHSSALLKVASIASCLSFLGLMGSNTMAIYEGNKRGMIRPLKITSIVCFSYAITYVIILICTDFGFTSEIAGRLTMLAGFVGVAWFVILMVALVLSKSEQNKVNELRQKSVDNGAVPVGKSDEELRREIEEQVRREMIEKEVRERLEKEQGQSGNGA